LFNGHGSIAFGPKIEQLLRIVRSFLCDDARNVAEATEIDCRIWEMIVRKRFTRLLKDDIDFLKGEALDLFVIRIRNMELCLQSITTVIGEASEVMFI